LIVAPSSISPLVIFGAVVASRVSTIIVGWSVFSGSFRNGTSVSVPDICCFSSVCVVVMECSCIIALCYYGEAESFQVSLISA